MRRRDREMPEAFAWQVAEKCEWAVLGLIDPAGAPYTVPVSIACEAGNIYFHSARQGLKADCLQSNAAVCLSCVGDTRPLENAFSTEYESAIFRGTATEVTKDTEKIHALKLLCQRHTPANMHSFDAEISRYLARTAVWRIAPVSITGKRNQQNKQSIQNAQSIQNIQNTQDKQNASGKQRE